MARAKTGNRETLAVMVGVFALIAWPAASLALQDLREIGISLLHAALAAVAAGLLYAPILRALGRACALTVVGLVFGLPGALAAHALGTDSGLTFFALVLVWRGWERLKRPAEPQLSDAARLGGAVAALCAARPAGLAVVLLMVIWMGGHSQKAIRPLRVWFAFAAPALGAVAALQLWGHYGGGPPGPVDGALASALAGPESGAGILVALGSFPWPGAEMLATELGYPLSVTEWPRQSAAIFWGGWGAAAVLLVVFRRVVGESLESTGSGSLAVAAALFCIASYVLYPAATPPVLVSLHLVLATLFGAALGPTRMAWPLALVAIASAIAQSVTQPLLAV